MAPETVADAAAFKCIMERRKAKHPEYAGSGGGFQVTIPVDANGAPATPWARRWVCEMEKLALGSETAFIDCGEVMKAHRLVEYCTATPSLPVGTLIRRITLRMSRRDFEDLDPLIVPVITGERIRVGRTYCQPLGDSCAFPGGCD